MNDDYESRLWRLLEKEKLADLSQFHQPGFDEVPLFSRKSDIDFLPKENDTANQVLLGFALKFLSAVIAYEKHHAGYFAAVTVCSLFGDPLIPNLFVWCGETADLKERLVLEAATSAFGKRIKGLISKFDLGEKFDIREDASTVSDATRVFIAPARPPYPGFAALRTFRRQARIAK
jgi:hypothetical protein